MKCFHACYTRFNVDPHRQQTIQKTGIIFLEIRKNTGGGKLNQTYVNI